jgi:hypothetical protein
MTIGCRSVRGSKKHRRRRGASSPFAVLVLVITPHAPATLRASSFCFWLLADPFYLYLSLLQDRGDQVDDSFPASVPVLPTPGAVWSVRQRSRRFVYSFLVRRRLDVARRFLPRGGEPKHQRRPRSVPRFGPEKAPLYSAAGLRPIEQPSRASQISFGGLKLARKIRI